MSTISDVAKRAGVSAATVSRVIQGAKNVHQDTRDRVESAIAELGYVPSAVAQSLRSRRTHTLALVVPDITNIFWTTVARGVEDTAQAHDYSVFLCNTDENPGKQLRYLDVVIGQRADGVIIAPYDSDARHLAKLRDRRIPTVVVDRRIDGWEVDSVTGDSVAGARALVGHLIGLGHTRIAVVSGSSKTSTAEDRVTGYCLALADAGLPIDPDLIRRGEFLSASGQVLAGELLDLVATPTAIFATNNAIATGVIDAVGQRGLRIPQDIALVSFDDLPVISHVFPFLTVALQPAYDMGVHAAQLVLSRLASEATLQPRHVLLPLRLIVRHSCGSRMHGPSGAALSLPLPDSARAEDIVLVKSSRTEAGWEAFSAAEAPATVWTGSSRSGTAARPAGCDRADFARLLRAVRHEESDRVPHIEFSLTSQAVYEYVLERDLKPETLDPATGGQVVSPEDQVELARRLGLDAVVCTFSWRLKRTALAGLLAGRWAGGDGEPGRRLGSLPAMAATEDLAPLPSLAGQLSRLERTVRAAQGTGVGVIADFALFFEQPLAAEFAALAAGADGERPMPRFLLERLVTLFVEHQEAVARLVCDRFAADLALVMVTDNLTGVVDPPLPVDALIDLVRRLVFPAREHGKPLLWRAGRDLGRLLPALHSLGFDAAYPSGLPEADFAELRRQWAGRMALAGNVPASLLSSGSEEQIEEAVRQTLLVQAPGGGFILSSSGGIGSGIAPESFLAMVRAAHRYGCHGALGQPMALPYGGDVAASRDPERRLWPSIGGRV